MGLESLFGVISIGYNEQLADLTPLFGLETVHWVFIFGNDSLCNSHAWDFADSIGEITGDEPYIELNAGC
jgi:hypothetical protein